MNPMNKIASLFICALALIALPHCAKYKPIPLGKPFHHKEKGKVEVAAREFTPAEFKHYFDTSIDCKKFIPLQLFVHNKSDKSITLEAKNLNLTLLTTDKVKRKMHRSTAARTVGWGVAGALLFAPLIIPAIVDGVRSNNANTEIDADMDKYAFGSDSSIEIKPGVAINKIMFAERPSIKSEPLTALPTDLDLYFVSNNNQIEKHFNFSAQELKC